jgi:hypothetical protein
MCLTAISVQHVSNVRESENKSDRLEHCILKTTELEGGLSIARWTNSIRINSQKAAEQKYERLEFWYPSHCAVNPVRSHESSHSKTSSVRDFSDPRGYFCEDTIRRYGHYTNGRWYDRLSLFVFSFHMTMTGNQSDKRGEEVFLNDAHTVS